MQDHMPDSPDSFFRVHVRSHTLYVPIKLSWLYPYSMTLPSITAVVFLQVGDGVYDERFVWPIRARLRC